MWGYKKMLREVERQKSNYFPPIVTGIQEIDEAIGEVKPQQLNLLAGSKSIDMNSLSGIFLTNMARAGKRVVYFSVNQKKWKVLQRLLDNSSNHELKELPIFVNDLYIPNIADICWWLTIYRYLFRVDMAIIDGLGLIEYSFNYSERGDEIEGILRMLKEKALRLNIPIFVTTNETWFKKQDFQTIDNRCYFDVSDKGIQIDIEMNM